MGTFIMLLIWIAIGVGCVVLAKSKNRSQIGWGIAGFLAGLFALILLAFLPKIEETKRCPQCANDIKLEARVCYICGNEFYKLSK